MCLEHSRTVLVSLLLSLVGETLAVETGGINLGSGSSYGEFGMITGEIFTFDCMGKGGGKVNDFFVFLLSLSILQIPFFCCWSFSIIVIFTQDKNMARRPGRPTVEI